MPSNTYFLGGRYLTNTSSSRQFKRLGTPGIGIIVLGLVLFVLIFFLEYTYSNKRGDLVGSIMYGMLFPGWLTASFLLFVTKRAERRQTHLPWHRQKSILVGLLFLSLSLISLVGLINSLMNNGLPDAVGTHSGSGFSVGTVRLVIRGQSMATGPLRFPS
jgi:amino acid transporter